jgi:hypothetical protein
VTVPDPEKQDRDGTARYGSPEDTDAAFASIVAGLQAQPDAPRWPTEDERKDPHSVPNGAPHGATDGKRMRDDADEDHFQPPEPPPLPVPRARTVGGMALLTVGLLLLGPNLLGLGEGVATPLGLLALTAGIGWLVIGLRSGPPPDGSDDGARL